MARALNGRFIPSPHGPCLELLARIGFSPPAARRLPWDFSYPTLSHFPQRTEEEQQRRVCIAGIPTADFRPMGMMESPVD